MPLHFLSLLDWQRDELRELLVRANWFKKKLKDGKPHEVLRGKTLAMIFEKPSTRTRVSFEAAMYQLGGHVIYISSETSQLKRGETYSDTARVLARYVDGIVMRTFEQARVEELARASTVPVINGLSDLLHPCQVLSDIFTVEEFKGNISRLKIVWLGDGNNMANTWIQAAIIFGFDLALACPSGYEPPAMILSKISEHKNVRLVSDPKAAVKDADVINTDTWVSMGQEIKRDSPLSKGGLSLFKPYQVNSELLKLAKDDAIVLHCLPAHREEEITSEVMDGEHSRIWDQAENRLHVQKAILERLMVDSL